MRPRLKAVAVGGALVLALAGGLLFAQSRLDRSGARRAVIAAVEQKSGHSLRLERLEVRLLPWPHIDAAGIALADADPGAPPMLSVGRLRASIGLWPLLRHVVRLDSVTLDHLVLHARRAADGPGNWAIAPGRGASSAGGAWTAKRRWDVEVGSVHVEDAALSWQDALLRRSGAVHLATLDGAGLQGERPHFALSGNVRSASYTLQGETGPLSRLSRPEDHSTPWRFSWQGSEQVAGAAAGRIDITGSLREPLQARGYATVIKASMGQLSDLNLLFPHAGLPSLQGLDASARLEERDGRPRLAALHAKAGPTALGLGQAGIRDVSLRYWSIDAEGADAPLLFAAGGLWHGRPVASKGSLGTLRMLQSLRAGGSDAAVDKPAPASMTLAIGGSTWQIDGIAGSSTGDLQITAQLPDVRELLGAAAPDLGPAHLTTRFAWSPGPAYALTALQLAADAGDMSGSASLSLQLRPTLRADLTSRHLDLDRILAAPGDPAAPEGKPSEAQAEPNAVAAKAPADGDSLPWPLLRAADADISLRVANLVSGGARFQDALGHVSVQQGRLVLDPARAQGVAGALSLRLQADANTAPPSVTISMQPALLPARLLARLAGAPARLQGNVELVGRIATQGDTRSALLASAEGHVGVSMVDGSLENAALAGALGRSGALAAVVQTEGATRLRCLGLHATLADRRMQLDTIGLRGDRVAVDGRGQLDLASQDLDLHLLAQVALGAAAATVPVRVTGTLSHPQPALEAAAPGSRFSLTIGAASTEDTDCASLLRSARESMPGPAPIAVRSRRKALRPADLFRSLGLLH